MKRRDFLKYSAAAVPTVLSTVGTAQDNYVECDVDYGFELYFYVSWNH